MGSERSTSGATVWLTGLSGSGKSTLAAGVVARLVDRGVAAYQLDGDRLRRGLNADLGYDAASRRENVRRVGEVARVLAHSGTVAVVALISPFEAGRRAARDAHDADGLPFVEVYLSAPLDVCEGRDPKGLYARARAGELSEVTGLDSPYEAPVAPELTIEPALTVEAATERVVSLLLPAVRRGT